MVTDWQYWPSAKFTLWQIWPSTSERKCHLRIGVKLELKLVKWHQTSIHLSPFSADPLSLLSPSSLDPLTILQPDRATSCHQKESTVLFGSPVRPGRMVLSVPCAHVRLAWTTSTSHYLRVVVLLASNVFWMPMPIAAPPHWLVLCATHKWYRINFTNPVSMSAAE